jgi:DNA-directed RNA polymerase subunit E'/Rpb7
METLSKTTQFKKRKDNKLQNIYSRSLLTRKIVLPINYIGKNLDDVIEEYIHNNFEGKCLVEGYVKPNSVKIIRYSSGLIERGNNIVFEVVFECDICFPVEGMLVYCVVKNIVKAGIRAEISNESPSPVVVFIAKDHHLSNQQFNEIQVNDIITVRVIGQRFELNDKYISVIGELVKEKDYTPKPKQTLKPRLVIQED